MDSTNKGFALLAKMGYKAGESLGKSKMGRAEPIPFEVKNNRTGLGRDAVIKEIKQTKAKLRSIQQSVTAASKDISTQDFRAAQSMKIRAKRIEGDLFRSQKACRQLDLAKEFTEPVEAWFWPKNIQEAPESIEPDEEEVKIREIVEDENEEEEENEDVDEIEIPPEEMLRIVTEYLRTEYLFCIWCGITFSDIEDLQNACPGKTREDHDD